MMPMMGKTYSCTPIMGNYGNTGGSRVLKTYSLRSKGACTKAASMPSMMGGKAKPWMEKLKQVCCLTADLMAFATLIYLFTSKGS